MPLKRSGSLKASRKAATQSGGSSRNWQSASRSKHPGGSSVSHKANTAALQLGVARLHRENKATLWVASSACEARNSAILGGGGIWRLGSEESIEIKAAAKRGEIGSWRRAAAESPGWQKVAYRPHWYRRRQLGAQRIWRAHRSGVGGWP